ncbi:hypothetical protein [Nitrospirillum sp. BR 11163]|uniref:hypothetical protein n=1 Tax=Nitrospirillum sp. BR 11163 TaxID=3104323 RepID=UPI002AFEE6A1|nr:hypothetical protein [Nitrospirillum sp. BR 11163]MEA1673847.1 hypothetical protein [Nitrospirillum sp. BR 11163]
MKSTRVALLCFLVALVPLNAAVAGGLAQGYITQIIPLSNGLFTFVFSGTPAGAPACATFANHWAVDVSTPSGQAIASSAITAFSAGYPMYVSGTGTCAANQSNTELVNYLAISKN